MNALDRVAAVLERARIKGGWDDEAVAHRVLIALDLDEDGENAATLVVRAACRWHAADIYVHPILSREEAVRVGATELIDAVQRYKDAQPAVQANAEQPTSSNLEHG